jgi:hypothetical protein
MTTSSILRTAWTALESETDQLPGLYERRVFATTGFAVFAGLTRPGRQLRFSVGVPASISTDGLERETKGFRVLRQYLANDRSTRVTLDMVNTSFRELFEVMAEDVAARILAAAEESSAVAAMRERLNHWERFMSASGPGGLSREKQIGLYGELTFLKTLLRSGIPAAKAITWWHGPDSKNQDFQAGCRAVEVKSTTGNSATTVRVSNELQLDDADRQPLFLLHLWLKEMEGSGTSLPQLVDELTALFAGATTNDFSDRLVAAGYHEVHRPLYESTGYAERERRYYAVEGTFPRIRHADLRPGVNRVEYLIDLAGFESFTRDEPVVLASFTGLSV